MKGRATPRTQGGWRIFRWPLAIGVASGAGLIAALVGDGACDVLSWILLGGSVAVMAEAWRRGARRAAAEVRAHERRINRDD
jgi:hypothetical protein